MKGDRYAAPCPRCRVVLTALTPERIRNKMDHHARLFHNEKIEWGPNQAGVPIPADPPSDPPADRE